ncbi:putative glycosyl [Golovinomyces cichoracearum]|uniref:Putative glycosyl n=1 Tax=Golovinomyces cichoracearum TaxID=62708 RepID=A0A420JAE0_9PEZI|nr:putative glycosyl [Golovinomyces cichoracearum]
MKYGGAEDSLGYLPKCRTAPNCIFLGNPTILKGNARKYYYHRIFKLKIGHEGSIKRIREHFETEERRQDHLAQWYDLSLQVIVHDNPGKSLMECLRCFLKSYISYKMDYQRK